VTDDVWSEQHLREVLTGESDELAGFRNIFRRVPSPPHCKLCAAPFEGPGGAILRHFGFRRFAANPQLCENCIAGFVRKGVTGAEIPLSMLFADVRGSTALAERMRPSEFRSFLGHFYGVGSDAILRHDGLVDKLVGDEIIGLFFGGVSGLDHARKAVAAARELLDRVSRADATPVGPIPVGAAVHLGEAYVGTTGPEGAVNDFTALGDAVNTTARLSQEAAAGELLVSILAAEAAGLDTAGRERRRIDLRGRTAPMEVVSFPTGARTPISTGVV
jgi:adenylate cyclase